MIEAKDEETEDVLLLGLEYERNRRGREERRWRKGHRQWRVRKRQEERGSSLSGDRPRVCQSVRGPRRNEGSPRWPPGSGAPVSPASATQHKSLPLRFASLCSLSRLLALILSLTVYRNATAPQIRACLCVYVAHSAITITFCGSLRSRWLTMLRFELAMVLPFLIAQLTLITLIKFLSLNYYFCRVDYF